MNIIVCVDDKNGMTFNKRRVSQDAAVRSDIYSNLEEKALIMNTYSFKMFNKDEEKPEIVVTEELPVVDSEGFQFIENKSLKDYEDKIEKIIVYYWNRAYPSDLKFDIDVSSDSWNMESEIEFAGSSHEKITKKIFTKKQ